MQQLATKSSQMSQQPLQIDISKSTREIKKRDMINIKLGEEDIIQVQYSQFFLQSKYIRDKYKYSEGSEQLQTELDNIEKKYNIHKTSFHIFIELIQEEKVSVPTENI